MWCFIAVHDEKNAGLINSGDVYATLAASNVIVNTLPFLAVYLAPSNGFDHQIVLI
jgi:hypothetical protein